MKSKNAKTTYQFTLVLKGVNQDTPDLEDSLYEAGCDDALINFRDGTVFLDFDREDTSLEEAVISAIKNVRSSTIDAEIASVAPENLVTESEIAKRLNKSRQAVSLWIKGSRRELFPQPIMHLAGRSPLWKWSEVTQWLYVNKIIITNELVDNAAFIVNINAAIERIDANTKRKRSVLFNKLDCLSRHHQKSKTAHSR